MFFFLPTYALFHLRYVSYCDKSMAPFWTDCLIQNYDWLPNDSVKGYVSHNCLKLYVFKSPRRAEAPCWLLMDSLTHNIVSTLSIRTNRFGQTERGAWSGSTLFASYWTFLDTYAGAEWNCFNVRTNMVSSQEVRTQSKYGILMTAKRKRYFL